MNGKMEEMAEEAKRLADLYLTDPNSLASKNLFLNVSKKSTEDKTFFDLFLNNIKRKLKEEARTEVTTENLIHILPSSVNTLRYPTTKLSLTLLDRPITTIEGVNVATQTDIGAGMNYTTTFNIIEDSNIQLPENFEFTSKIARYIDVVGSILEDPEVREQGGIIKVRHFINTMNGKNSQNVKDEKIEEVVEELNNLATIRIKIDAREHQRYNALKKGKNQIKVPYYTDYLLATRIMMIDDEYYMQMLTFPPLYQYAKEAGQIMTYQKHLIDLTRVYEIDDMGRVIKEEKTPIRYMTDITENIRDFFLRGELSRLEQMKRKGNSYIDILYSRLYEFLEEQDPNLNIPKRKGVVDGHIYNVLDILKRKGVIKDFNADMGKGRNKKYKIRIS